MENVIKGIDICLQRFRCGEDCPYYNTEKIGCMEQLREDALALLQEQEERLRKLQKDKDKLCLEVSEWKHKFHDAPPKFVSQGVVDQIRWERDTALSQLEQIGKGLGSKMDDIAAMLKEQEAVAPTVKINSYGTRFYYCPNCNREFYCHSQWDNYCANCGQAVKWE